MLNLIILASIFLLIFILHEIFDFLLNYRFYIQHVQVPTESNVKKND